MIELAPRSKAGLLVTSPILLAAGIIGCGDALPPSLRRAEIGAAVTGPISRSSRRGANPPRLAEGVGGFVLNSDLQNRGIAQSVKRCRRSWAKLPYPVLGQIADRDPDDVRYVAMQMEASNSVTGLELLVHLEASVNEVSALVGAIVTSSELPLWVKLPYGGVHLAAAAVSAGADALVVSQPPIGMLALSSWLSPARGVTDAESERSAGAPELVTGPLFGPSTGPLILQMLAEIIAQDLGVPLIACGGIYRWEDVSNVLSIGAQAVQVDGIAWVEPGVVDDLCAEWLAVVDSTGVE